jgi:hypothetical protein
MKVRTIILCDKCGEVEDVSDISFSGRWFGLDQHQHWCNGKSKIKDVISQDAISNPS